MNCAIYTRVSTDNQTEVEFNSCQAQEEKIKSFIKSQKDALQEEISYYESLDSQNQPVYITRSLIEKFRKEMEQIFMGNNVQEQRDFLKKFIEKIIVKEEGIEIIYYMAPQQ